MESRGMYFANAAGNRLTRSTLGGSSEPDTLTPYGLWPLDEVLARAFTPPAAAFTSDGDTLGLYHMEESQSPMIDSSSGANDADIVGTVTTQAAGLFAECIRLAPDAETPGRLEANPLALGSADWTLEAFVYPEAERGERTVLAQAPWRIEPDEEEEIAGVLGTPVLLLSIADGRPALLVRYSVSGQTGELRLVGSSKVTQEAWQHLAAVRNGLRLSIYMGGQCVATGQLPSGASAIAGDKLLIGCGDVNTSGVRASGNFAGKLDEVRISSVARYTGLVTPEVTANGPDGELVGEVSLADSGRFGPALAFGGSGYVKLTDDGNFLKLGAAKRTIEMWVKADSTSGTQMLYEEGGSTNGFAVRIDSGELEFIARDSSGTPKTLTAAYTSTDWHKVTAVFDEGDMALYVDGSSVDSDTADFTSVSAQADGAALGGTLGSDAFGGSTTGGSFSGCLDAVRVIADAAAPNTGGPTEVAYTYNERSQLTLEEIAGGNHKHYTYNKNGENTEIVEHDSGENVVKTITMTYDVFGRMLTWSDGTDTETHTYRGAEWHRATTASGGTTTRYLYDGDNVVGDLVSGTFTRQYVTPFLDENVSMTVIGGEDAGVYYYNRDGLGSVRNLTDANENVQSQLAYTAFGGTYPFGSISGAFQRYTFTGRESSGHSAAGAPMYYRNRQYSPSLGRFGRRDPVLDTRNNFAPYVSVRNRPIGDVDPSGMFDCVIKEDDRFNNIELDGTKVFFRSWGFSLTDEDADNIGRKARSGNGWTEAFPPVLIGKYAAQGSGGNSKPSIRSERGDKIVDRDIAYLVRDSATRRETGGSPECTWYAWYDKVQVRRAKAR
jgi:RHS repeat-associated protein